MPICGVSLAGLGAFVIVKLPLTKAKGILWYHTGQTGAAMESFELGQYATDLENYFASLEGVVLAYLFGSYARGRAWAQSDVDVAVLLEGRPGDHRCLDMRLEVIGGLMGILHTDDVDVLILNQPPPALRYSVLRDGIVLFCRDRQVMIEFRVGTLNEYLDFKPFLKRHGDAILEKARKGDLLGGYDAHKDALEP